MRGRCFHCIVEAITLNTLSNRIDPSLEVVVQGGSHDVRLALGADGHRLAKLPFSVGRRLGLSERAIGRPVDLALHDRRPFQLSRCHFAIIRNNDGLAVIDTGSRQGTIVNGTRLGESTGLLRAALRMGENSVIAGGPGSPYRFTVYLRALSSSLRKVSSA